MLYNFDNKITTKLSVSQLLFNQITMIFQVILVAYKTAEKNKRLENLFNPIRMTQFYFFTVLQI